MAEYKVVYRDDAIEWQPGCPILLEAVQVSRNTADGSCFLQTKVRNVSGSEVGKVVLEAIVNPGPNQEVVEVVSLDADVASGAVFVPKPVPISSKEIEGVIASVSFVDAMGGFGPGEPLPTAGPLLLSREAAEERTVRLREAGLPAGRLGGAIADHGGWWVCSCGNVNVGTESCLSCKASKGLLSSLQDQESLEAQSRERAEREAANARKSARARRVSVIGVTAALAVVAAVLIVTQVVVPSARYSSAMELYESGEYELAAEAFASLGDYKDSAEMANAAIYDKAMECYESDEFEKAAVTFESLDGYRDSAEWANEARLAEGYAVATSLYESGDYVAAAEAFDELGDYRDSFLRFDEANLGIIRNSEVGDIVRLGSYPGPVQWRILAMEDGRALLISVYTLDMHEFNQYSSDGNDWESSDLNAWLNSEFKSEIFNPDVASTMDGDFFCLSFDEVLEYFPSFEGLTCEAGGYAKGDYATTWWLRSPGWDGDYDKVKVVSVSFDGHDSYVTDDFVSSILGVRPAFWINL